MRILLSLFVFSSLFLLSCQKEADFANGTNNGGGGGTAGTLLKRIVSKSGSDSSQMVFGYNSSQKLVTLDITSVSGGVSAMIRERAVRDAQGIIQKLIIKSDQYQQYGIDSVVTIMQYSSGRYTSKVTTIDIVVAVLKDSISLIYDASGRVVSERSYSDFASGSYEEIGKIDYTYSGNNIATIKSYNYDPTTPSYELAETYTYDEYDSKVSPFSLGNEGFVFDSPAFYSANNPTKSSIAFTGINTENYTTTYTYNSADRPLTASSNVQPGNLTITGTYYYQ